MPEVVGFAVLGLLTGLAAGAFGVGGGFVLVPALTLAGLPLRIAIATSLAYIVLVAGTAAARHLRQGSVDLVLALPVAATAAVAAQGGARLAGALPERALSLLFAATLLGTAAWFSRSGLAPQRAAAQGDRRSRALPGRGAGEPYRIRPARAALIGAVAGTASGLLGVSAGFLTVPLLSGWLAIPAPIAVGTGALSSSVTALSGVIAHAGLHELRWDLLAMLVPGGLAGAVVGARLSVRLTRAQLRRAFTVVMVAAAVKPLLDGLS